MRGNGGFKLWAERANARAALKPLEIWHHADMHATLPQLISALLQPVRYAHPVSAVDLVQTHISWVLLAGEFAYKIKKPVSLKFLDFGTLEQRRLYCEEELRLNRRFAPDIYLEVVPIAGTPEEPLLGGAGAAIEYAVKMRRFDEAGRLDRVCERAELRPEHLSDLAVLGVSLPDHERREEKINRIPADRSSEYALKRRGEFHHLSQQHLGVLGRLCDGERVRQIESEFFYVFNRLT